MAQSEDNQENLTVRWSRLWSEQKGCFSVKVEFTLPLTHGELLMSFDYGWEDLEEKVNKFWDDFQEGRPAKITNDHKERLLQIEYFPETKDVVFRSLPTDGGFIVRLKSHLCFVAFFELPGIYTNKKCYDPPSHIWNNGEKVEITCCRSKGVMLYRSEAYANFSVTNNVIISFEKSPPLETLKELQSKYGLTNPEKFSENDYFFVLPPTIHPITAVNNINEDILSMKEFKMKVVENDIVQFCKIYV
jgi:hypothetical protein